MGDQAQSLVDSSSLLAGWPRFRRLRVV